VSQHACKLGGVGSRYRAPDWLKFKNPEAPAVKREAEVYWR
jgi:hypothetical protein